MIVIGITGESPVNGVHAGKDTAAEYLRAYLESRGLKVRVQAWADKLKVSAARALGERGSDEHLIAFCDRLKTEGAIQVSFTNPGNRDGARKTELSPFSGRQYLEWLGTEGGRDVHGKNVWVDLALPSPGPDFPAEVAPAAAIWRARHGFPNVIIDTTTRFPNEQGRIREWGGQVWRIERPGVENEPGQHESKYGLPREACDVLITNGGTLEELRERIIIEAAENLELPV